MKLARKGAKKQVNKSKDLPPRLLGIRPWLQEGNMKPEMYAVQVEIFLGLMP